MCSIFFRYCMCPAYPDGTSELMPVTKRYPGIMAKGCFSSGVLCKLGKVHGHFSRTANFDNPPYEHDQKSTPHNWLDPNALLRRRHRYSTHIQSNSEEPPHTHLRNCNGNLYAKLSECKFHAAHRINWSRQEYKWNPKNSAITTKCPMSGKKKFEKCLIQLKDVNILGVSTLHSVFFFFVWW